MGEGIQLGAEREEGASPVPRLTGRESTRRSGSFGGRRLGDNGSVRNVTFEMPAETLWREAAHMGE